MKALLAIGVLCVLATIAVGLLHTRAGMALWKRSTPTGSCPFGYDVAATPETRNAVRRAFAASHRGTSPTPSRGVDRWTLATTTRADVEAWTSTTHARCTNKGGDLVCANIAGFDEVWLGFDEHERLVALTQLRSATSPAPIHDAFAKLEHVGEASWATPAEIHEADLSRGALQQSFVEWRFSDFYASARATNMGHDRFVLVDEYRAF